MEIFEYLPIVIVGLVGVDIFNGYRLGSKITGKSSEELQAIVSDALGDLSGTIDTAKAQTKKTQDSVDVKFSELINRLENLEKLATASQISEIADVTDAQVALAKLLDVYTKYQQAKANGDSTALDAVITDFKATGTDVEDLKKFAEELASVAEEIKAKL